MHPLAVAGLPVVPRDGDVFLERGSSWLSRMIQKFTKSEWNHVGLIFNMTRMRRKRLNEYGRGIPESWVGEWCVVEASWTIHVSLLHKRICEPSIMRLARLGRLTSTQRINIVRIALEFVGQRYGVRRLFAFAMDILNRTHSVRRMSLDVLVCSYLDAYPYDVNGEKFGVETPREVTPGDIDRTITMDEDWHDYWQEVVEPPKPAPVDATDEWRCTIF